MVLFIPIVSAIVSAIVNFFRPFLRNLLGSFYTKIMAGFVWFAAGFWGQVKVFFDRLPFYLAWSAAFYSAFFLFVQGATFLITSVNSFMPNSVITAASWFLPSNVAQCLSVVYSSKLYRFLYDQKMIVLNGRLVALAGSK
ncbi:MAG: hypothetical protein GQ532_06210 [Methylomarinum sp.]|nr:hypothetical protein [Methylomarinum sp.]